MFDKNNRCVYNGLEYILTGRRALNRSRNKYVFELKPMKTFGFGDDLNIWASLEDIFIIEEEEDEN